MSEELKRKAAEFLRQLGPSYNEAKANAFYDETTTLMAEFAAQVREQRAKLSSKLTPSEWLRENGFGDSAVASDVFDKDGDPHALIGLMDEYGQQRAEAAELALQSRDKRISELGADICNMNDSIAEIVCQDLADWDWKTCLERVKNLRAALQAKERELAKICEAHNYGVNILTELAAAKLEAAQARQQAIAETIPIIERHKHYVEDCDCLEVMLDEIRSLTSPPSQSKGANMNTGTIIDELPDAFRRMPGTITEKMTAYREFCNDMIAEIQAAYDAIPDSLNRNLAARIAILKERADRESKLAVVLAQRLHEKGDDFHSHLVFENGAWLTPPPALTKEK